MLSIASESESLEFPQKGFSFLPLSTWKQRSFQSLQNSSFKFFDYKVEK